MYTQEQQSFLEYVTQKVKDLFEQFPVPAHSFDHAEVVAKYARQIAEAEGAKNIWLSEVSGILHDIGRVSEVYTVGNTLGHQELSYILLKKWFGEDRAFDMLSTEEKIELLYAVRYHWNDAADDYDTAWILRDADKIDLFGLHGIERSRVWCEKIDSSLDDDCRMKYYCWYWVHTNTAKKMVQEKGLVEEMDEYRRRTLREKIEPIEL